MCADTSSDNPTILVADDDPDLVALIARRLRKVGYCVITAFDGEEALQMAESRLPHLAVLDIMMPKLTGIEVLNRLRDSAATKDMPVILISAGFHDDVIRDVPGGANDFIKKPFGPQELPIRVQAVLAR